MYDFKERFNKLLSLNKIRFYKIIEIIEYTILFFILLLIISYLLNTYYYKIKKNNENNNEKNKKTFFQLCFTVLIQTILIIIIFFYLRKIVLLVPSIITLFDKEFIPYTTYHYLNNVALVYLFMNLIPQYSYNIDELRQELIK